MIRFYNKQNYHSETKLKAILEAHALNNFIIIINFMLNDIKVIFV